MYETLDRMEAYLLGDGGILLDPDLVYVDPEGFKTGFCVIPGRKEDFNSQLSLFIQYLMKHIDHKDRECVVLTYGLYQTCMKENYSLEQIIKECVKEEEENVLAEDKNTDLGTEEEKEGSTYFDRTEHDWIASQEMGSTILRETENLWTPMKRFLHRRRKPKWGDWDGLYIEEEDL